MLGVLLVGTWLGPAPANGAPAGPPPRVQALFDLGIITPSPFPSDWFTVADATQRTGLRIANPLTSCVPARSICDDLRLLGELDGFDLDPRLAVRFSGAIDVASVTPRSVFLIRLVAGPPELTAVDRVVWDPESLTLYARPENLLEPETRYGFVVTRELRDSLGRPIDPSATFAALLRSGGGPPIRREHRAALGLLRRALERRGIRTDRIALASVFTTGSVSTFLEQARDALDRRLSAPALITTSAGGGRAWFPRASLSRLVLRRQVAVMTDSPAGAPTVAGAEGVPAGFRDEPLPLDALPGDVVGGIGVGWYWSPWYLTADRRIIEAPTLAPHRGAALDHPVPFVVITPVGRPPPEGWPLAVFGHGYGGEMFSSALLVAGGLARQGIATIAISVVGHGGGRQSHLLVGTSDGRLHTVRVPGRGVDLDGDGHIESTEGLSPLPGGPFTALGLRDGLRQQVVDLMALVRVIGYGLDVDGDWAPDTGQGELFYAGHSLGAIYGTLFLAVEPRVRVGALVVAGGPVAEVARLSPVFRPRVRDALERRLPSLLNLPGDFREDLPLRGDAPVVAPALGAPSIQAYLSRVAWLGRRADPVAYARHLRQSPLPGLEPARVLLQYALGDPVVPNSTTATLVRAGELGDRTVVVRTDRVARAAGAEWPDPHGFLLAVRAPGLIGRVAKLTQEQLGRFLRDAGEAVWVPSDPASVGPDGPFLEVAGASQ